MDATLVKTMLGLSFVCCGLPMFFLLAFLLNALARQRSGWHELEEFYSVNYALNYRVPTSKGAVSVGTVRFKRGISIWASGSGVYLSPTFIGPLPMRILHIPWTNITRRRVANTSGGPHEVILQPSLTPQTAIRITRPTYDALVQEVRSRKYE